MTQPSPKTAPTLKRRAIVGSATAIAGFGTTQSIRLAGNLIMTRLLAPEAFGLMAIAVAINMWLNMLTDFGVKPSIIRSKNADDPAFLATAWTLQIARSALIAMALAGVGFMLIWLQESQSLSGDKIYGDPRLSIFIWGISLSVLITGFASIKATIAERKVQLNRVVTLEVAAQLIAVFVSVALAARGAGAYALVAGMIASTLFTSAGSFIIFSGPHSRIGFHKKYFFEIFDYGKWLLVASFLGFILNRGSQILFGAFMTKLSFSFLAIAAIWVNAAEAVISTLLHRIAYPTFSEIYRSRPHDIARTYRTFRLFADISCIALFLAIYFVADIAFDILYTEEYAKNVAPYVKLLSVMVLFLPYRLLSIFLLAAGDSKKFTAILAAPAAILVIFVPILFKYVGEDAAILFTACIHLFSIPMTWRFTHQQIKLNYVREAIPAIIAFVFVCLILL